MSATTTVIQAVNRKRRVWNSSLRRRPECIAPAADRVDQRLLDPALQLGAWAIDMLLVVVRVSFPVRLPQGLAQHLAGEDLPGVPHQLLGDGELGRGRVVVGAGRSYAPRRQIGSGF